MPLVNDMYGDEPVGRKKHGGPLVHMDPAVRDDGLTYTGGQMWNADGAPFARMTFRAAPDNEEEELYRRRDPIKKIHNFITEYKQAMIDQGRESEILASPEGHTFEVEDGLPEEAIESMQKAFAEKDTEAMAKAMIELDKYDPKHKNFDDRIQFWMKEFGKAWGSEFAKDKKEAQEFVLDTLEPFMPPEFKEIEKDRVELEKYEEKKAKALEVKRQKQQETGITSFPPALDLTDSSLTVVQARSSSMEWETKALMGAHPGVMFGCHCSASLDSFPFEGLYGDYPEVFPPALDFARRYPKSKDRQTLPDGCPE